VIARRLRAFDSFPGASGVVHGEAVKLWRGIALPAVSGAAPGRIVAVGAAGVDVACGQGCLRLTQLQRAGGKRLPVADFLRGFDLTPGMSFQAVSP